MANVIVTGATGFIGYHLVRHLSATGHDVACLVRRTSDCSRLKPYTQKLIVCDVGDRESVRRAVSNHEVDFVFHLAGLTKTLRAANLHRTNVGGVRNVVAACAKLRSPPVVVLVSSLAAAGPARRGKGLTESETPSPVSLYGRSKRAGELAAAEFAARVPITIVRPPIVFGEADRDGFALFEGIAKWGVHLVPGISDHIFSVIHAEDLTAALVMLARDGRRIGDMNASADGIYYAAADEIVTYAELGRMIGRALGRDRVMVIRNPKPAVWSIAALNELVSRLVRRPHILNLDKAREATAGSWACSADALRRDTGFAPALPLAERLEQTAQWYVEEGWLPGRKRLVQT